jgi:hypothetical protein
MSYCPHVYTFSIHPQILSESEFLFSEFNPYEADCCFFPKKRYWATEYSFQNLPAMLSSLKEYAYQELCMAGFQVLQTGRMVLCDFRGHSDHMIPPEHLFTSPSYSRVHMLMIFTKDKSMYDSGLILKRRVSLKHPYLQYLSVEHVTKTPLYESVGVMYQEENYIEYIGGTGLYRMISFAFDKKR